MADKKFIPYGLHEITEEDKRAVIGALESNWITSGPTIKKFEEEICSKVNSKFCVALSSGTAALEVAVASLQLPEGSEIITTPYTFMATANAIRYNHCMPVFADILNDTYCLDPVQVKKKITDKTKAIITVDFAGHPSELDELHEIASWYNLYLIEDAAHAFGAEYKNRKVGNIADLTTFSFHPVKHVTTGEGGAVTTNNEEVYKKMLCLRNHGIDKDASQRYGPGKGYMYDMKYLGRNYRITDFQCALGLSQIKRLEQIIEIRNAIAEKYSSQFSSIQGVQLPVKKKNIKHAWHLYTLLLPENVSRDEFYDKMRGNNIGVNVHYIPVYKFTNYKQNFNFNEIDYPVTENVFKKTITLPLHTLLTEADLNYVIHHVKSILGGDK